MNKFTLIELACASLVMILPAKKPHVEHKFMPNFKEVDPKIRPIYDEWMELSTGKGLVFSKSIGIGFTDIVEKRIIGRCHYGIFSRVIEIDRQFWNHASSVSRKILLFHEMAHCFCGRPHDWAKGKEYPELKNDEKEGKSLTINAGASVPNNEGYFDDFCPKSILHPTMISHSCYFSHYQHYTEEMFDRCKPY